MSENVINLNQLQRTIRRIIRSLDVHSKKLAITVGVTGPQLVVLKEIQNSDKITTTQLAENISLSQSTATTILDSLVKKELVIRLRDDIDKRQWHLELSPIGRSISKGVNYVLPKGFVTIFDSLPYWHQNQIIATLQHVAEMMSADDCGSHLN